MARKDIHRPSAIVPTEYAFVGLEYSGASIVPAECAFLLEQRARIAAHQAQTGGKYSNHEHGGSCHICGATALYKSVFYHAPSNSYIVTGQDCAEKLEMMFDAGEVNRFRKQVKFALEAAKGKRKAQALLAQAGIAAAWTVYLGEGDTALFVGGYEHNEENKIREVVGSVVRYGKLTEPQAGFLSTLLSRISNRPAIEAARKAEHEAAADCPEGRVTIVGEVCGFKEVASDFGVVNKMIVKAEAGFKVFGTCNIDCKRGDRVSFVATVERSKDDSKFGFFKRPAKGVVISTEGK